MMLHRASRYTLALALLALPALPAAARAQAFGLNEIGSCASARGFAATAAPCDDASSIYWNPGAVQKARGFSFYGGVASIDVSGDFTQDTTGTRYPADLTPAYVPHLFLNYRGAGRASYGIGVFVPYGLTSQWHDDFPGRFSAKRASLQTIYVQPNLTYQLNDHWSIGGGPVFGHSTVELIQSVDLSTVAVPGAPAGVVFGNLGIPKRTEFATASLKGSATAYGVDLGLHGQINPEWQMGLRFLSQLSFNYDDADAVFKAVPTGLTLAAGNPLGAPAGAPLDAAVASAFTTTLTNQKVKTQIRHPAQVQAGFGYTGFQNTTITGEYSYVGWKSFNQLPVNFQGSAPSKVLQEDYNNTSGIRLGVDHRLSNGYSLRAGYMATAAAAPDETVTPLLPEQDRAAGTLGAGIPFGSFALDLAYSHIFTPGRRGRIDERATGSTQAQAIALNSGVYTLSANILMASVKASF